MKNIIKNLIFVIALVGVFGVGANFAFAVAPTVVSTTATNVTATSAVLNGVVNPNGLLTSAYFETPTTSLLQVQNLQNGTQNVTMVTHTLSGLSPNTTYSFQVVAGNSSGITTGTSVSFITTGSGNGNTCSTNGPTISSISPSDVTAGASQTDVTITGTNFTSASVALFGGADRTYAFVNSTTLTMRLPDTELDTAGTASVTVRDTVNGTTCTSNSRTFTINSSGGGGGGGSTHYATVVTETASNTTGTSAILNGTVDPNGYTTTSWFEYGTSSGNLSSSTAHIAQGSGTSTLDFAQSISGLTPNTTYYFRAVANNQYGTRTGTTLSFVTDAAAVGVVTTVQATSVNSTSARINGIFTNQSGTSASGYFEYGTSASFGGATTLTSLGTTSSVSFSNSITGLTAGRIYYFRAAATQGSSTYYGNTLTFQTTNSATNNNNNNNTGPVVSTTQSSILSITSDTDGYITGDEIDYLVTFKNTSKNNFENVKVIVQLPKEVDFKESNFGKEESKNTIVSYVGTLLSSQVGSMTIKGKVNSKASGQSLVVTTAVMSYFELSSNSTKDAIAYVTNHFSEGGNLTAASLFGDGSFLPSSLLGWVALLLIILGLVVIGRRLYMSYMLKTSKPGDGNHINNLPV